MHSRRLRLRRNAWRFLIGLAFGVTTLSPLAAPDVTKAPAAPTSTLVVVEASGDGVKLNDVTTPKVEFTLTVFNPASEAKTGVIARLSEFKNTQLQSAAALVDGKSEQVGPFEISGFSTRPLKISVDLPKAGTYSARLWLVVDKASHATPIQLVRIDKTASLSIGNLIPVKIDAPLCGLANTDSQRVSVSETAGVEAALQAPELQSVLYKPSATVSIQAPGIGLVSSSPSTVPARGKVDFDVRLTGFATPGRYEATLAFASPPSAPVTRSVAVYVRESWIVAAAWIAFGVLVAFALRFYGSVLAPRLALQTRGAEMFQQLHECALKAAKDTIAAQVVDAMRDALTARWNTLAVTARLAGSKDLDLYEAKIPLLREWLRLRAGVPKGLPPVTQDLANTTLGNAQTVILNPAATAAEIEAQASKLGAMSSELERSAFVELMQAVTGLKQELAANTEPGAQGLHAEVVAFEARLASGPKSVTQVTMDLNRLQMRYVELLIEGLREFIGKPLPVTMDAQRWSTVTDTSNRLLDDARKALDPETAVAAYRAAFRTVAAFVLTALIAELSAAIAAAGPGASERETLRDQAKTLLAGVAAIPPACKMSDLTSLLAAQEALRQHAAQKRLGPLATAKFEVGDLLKGLGESTGPSLFDFGLPLPASVLKQRGALHHAKDRSIFWKCMALAVIGVFAVLVGLKALWADDWAWGGSTAYLIAFLWGAGLSGFSYDGVTGLLGKFIK